MAHPRKLIRHAIVGLLTNATSAGTRVSATRVDPHKKTELPALSVYTLSEPVDPASAITSPRELTREVKVEIAGWVAHSQALPVDDAMDDLAEQIELAMDADPYILGTAGDSVLENTEMTVEAGDPLVGIVTLTYSVTYRTFVDQTVATDDFLRAGVTTKVVGGVADTAPLSDLVTVQEPPP